MLEIRVFENYDELSKAAAEIVKETIESHEYPLLGLATGSSPVGLYKELVRMHKEDELDFSKVHSVNLDEYVGLDGSHPQSYRYFMNENLFDHVNIDKANTYVPDGLAEDLEASSKEYDQWIRENGPIHLQVLGIGTNGHIGFNEPADKLKVGTHVEDLVESTIDANARFFENREDVPKQAVSMGLGTIMSAQKIVLVASGRNKAEAIKALEDEYITTQVPATLLKLHPNVIVLVDKDAAELLQ